MQVGIAGKAGQLREIGLGERGLGLSAVQEGTVGVVVERADAGDAALISCGGLRVGGRATAEGGAFLTVVQVPAVKGSWELAIPAQTSNVRSAIPNVRNTFIIVLTSQCSIVGRTDFQEDSD